MFSFRVRNHAVPAIAAAVAFSAIPVAAVVQPAEPLDINTATAEELTELPRIGEVTAARIVEWREENGPFTSTEELMNIQGIGERVYEQIRPHVRVSQPSENEPPAESSGKSSAIRKAFPALGYRASVRR